MTHYQLILQLLTGNSLNSDVEVWRNQLEEHFLIQSHFTVQPSQALISILSGVLQLLLAEEELLWPQRDSLTETSVITPAEIFPGT